jgi:hypothetical protein
MLGRYSFSVPDAVAKGELRPLRNPALIMRAMIEERIHPTLGVMDIELI